MYREPSVDAGISDFHIITTEEAETALVSYEPFEQISEPIDMWNILKNQSEIVFGYRALLRTGLTLTLTLTLTLLLTVTLTVTVTLTLTVTVTVTVTLTLILTLTVTVTVTLILTLTLTSYVRT